MTTTASVVTELTDANVVEFLSSGDVVIKAWQDDCIPCIDYHQDFEDFAASRPGIKFGSIKVDKKVPSFFRRKYMVAKNIGDQIGTPMTFLFRDGVEVNRYYGRLYPTYWTPFLAGEDIAALIKSTKPAPVAAPKGPRDITKDDDRTIKARGFEILQQINMLQNELQIIEAELLKRRSGRG